MQFYPNENDVIILQFPDQATLDSATDQLSTLRAALSTVKIVTLVGGSSFAITQISVPVRYTGDYVTYDSDEPSDQPDLFVVEGD